MGVSTFSQENGIIPLTALAASATSELNCDSFNMSGYDQATILIHHSASVTANNILSLECGATSGADSGDATFHYRIAAAVAGSAGADTYAADQTTSALTLTAADYQGKTLIVELHADELPKSGETVYNWVTVNFDGNASTATVMVYVILSKARYAKAVMPSAIPA